MKKPRIVFIVIVLAVFCWLNWWILPELAIVNLGKRGSPLPPTGYVLFGLEQHKYAGYRVVSWLEFGWAGVLAAWPYVSVGLLSGLLVGWPMGELARRQFAVDRASCEAIEKAQELETSGTLKLEYCMRRELELNGKQQSLLKQKVSLEAAREELQQDKNQFENKLLKFESLELAKANRTIQKLEQQVKRFKRADG